MMINNSNFKIKEIPDYHPVAELYERDEFFGEQKKRCIEGYWVSGKWMPPELYYYINFHNILFEDGIYRGIGLPWLRDIDWEKGYIYAEATGFSGFELDEEYTCHRFIRDNKPDADILKFCTIGGYNKPDKEYLNNFYKKDGTRKKYISAREYLRKIHSKNLGKPLYLNEAQHIIEMASRGYGKALPVTTRVQLFNGSFKVMGDISIGDNIIGNDGRKTTVTGVYDQGIRPTYKITLSDKREVFADEEHLWGVYIGRKQYKVLTTKQILNKGLKFDSGKTYRFSLPKIEPIEYDKKFLLVNPYILGVILGDGNVTGYSLRIASVDDELINKVKNILGDEYQLRKDSTNCNYYISYKEAWYNPLKRELNQLGITGNCEEKIIPEDYLYSDIESRYELLRGLMDTDGSINKGGAIEFTSINKKLAEQVAFLTRSLGIRCQFGIDNRIGREHILPQGTKYTTKNLVYRVFMRTDKPIFSLSRKLNRIKPRKNKELVSIVNIEKVQDAHCKCITIDNESKLFLIEDYVPTHNSYFTSGLIAHNFLFDGARDYDIHLKRRQRGEPLQTDTVVGAIDAKYSNKLMNKVKIALEKLPGSKFVNIYGEQTFFPSPLAVTYTGSFAVGREVIAVNSKSSIQHVTFADNPLAAAGGRPNKVFIDEVGFMGVIKEAWEGVENTQAVADFKRLTMYGMGTGGLTTGGAVTYLQDIFYNPEAYGCLAFEDIWENKGKIGYFVPGTMALNQFKEGPNLITNEEKALAYIETEREKAKKTKSSTKIQGTIINKPIVPSEIFLRMEGTYFPIVDLKQALADLESNKILLQASYKAELIETSKNVIKIIPSDKQVITDYPMRRDSSMDAPVEIFEKPKLDNDGHVFDNRYIISLDPVDDDGNSDITRSLQSAFVLDTWTNKIVAEYTARTYLVDDYYENVRKLAVYYNAKILYESNKKGFYGYMKNKNALYMLAETPEILKDQDLIKSVGIGNRSLGVNVSTDKIKFYAINLILKWLESPSYNNPDKKNLYTIRSLGLLKELISYSMDVNADRVSALMILMIFREELDVRIEQRKQSSIKTTAQSDFWGRAYGNFRKDKVHRKLKNLTNYDVN